MNNLKNNYAFIDGANLHKGLNVLGWNLDYQRFRIWLKEKYSVQKAYIFIGFIKKYNYIYADLKKSGYILIFKEIIHDKVGKIKGNCDAELVLTAVSDYYENNFEKMILVSSDGDYACLVNFLLEKNKFHTIISPNNKNRLSLLLKRTNASIVYLDSQKSILEFKNKKAPDADETA